MGENTPNKYTEEEKKWIIAQHVTHKTFKEIMQGFRAKFGKDIPKSTVGYYNPESSTGGTPAQHLVDLYWRLKEKTEEALKRIDISDPLYRLRKLQNVIERHESPRGQESYDESDSRIIMKALKHARKEMGQFDLGTKEEDQKKLEERKDPEALLESFMEDEEEEDEAESEEIEETESGSSSEST